MKYIFTSILALGVLAGCKKVDEPQSTEELLRGGAWKLNSSRVSFYDPSTGRDTNFSIFADIPDCVKDNTLKFEAGYQGIEGLGGNLCSSGASELPFEWGLYNGNNSIRIYGAEESFMGNGSINADLLTVTSNRFVIRYQEIEQDAPSNTSDTATITNVYTR